MRNLKSILGTATVTALLLGATSASAEAIVGSKHDLSGGGAGGGNNDARICVYCHTPHAANTDMIGAPLWNKPVPDAGAFTMYGKTLAGTETADTPSMVSLACLSCHDGVSAVNSVVNAPGTGGVLEGGAGTLITGGRTGTLTGLYNIANDIGKLQNDHPISIDYIPGRASLVPLDTPLSGAGWGSYTTVGSLLRNGKVECGTCHDPHGTINVGAGDGTRNPTFLRNTNTGSALCLTCHAK